jgi:16S rRNA C1402 (ribose-2'-O) methylase RsmI
MSAVRVGSSLGPMPEQPRRPPTSRLSRSARLGGLVAGQSARWVGTRAANVVRSPERADAATGDRAAALARELTKRFEEVRRGTVRSLHEGIGEGMRGEVALVIAGAAERAPSDAEARDTVTRMRSEGASSRDIVQRLTDELGVARNVAYKLAHSPPDSTPAG